MAEQDADVGAANEAVADVGHSTIGLRAAVGQTVKYEHRGLAPLSTEFEAVLHPACGIEVGDESPRLVVHLPCWAV